MKEFFGQFGSLLGAGVAAACCLGVPVILSMLGAVGLGFVVHDAYLLPLFVGFVGLSLWSLYRSSRQHAKRRSFWLALAGGVIGSVGLWLLVTGKYPHTWPVYTGLALLVGGSVWGIVYGRSAAAQCETTCVPESSSVSDVKRRVVSGAALSVAAAGVFYGLYKSVDAVKPTPAEDEIACSGVNSCKGMSACTTALNACTGQNACKGRGYINVSATECKAKGGQPLEGSAGDPAKG